MINTGVFSPPNDLLNPTFFTWSNSSILSSHSHDWNTVLGYVKASYQPGHLENPPEESSTIGKEEVLTLLNSTHLSVRWSMLFWKSLKCIIKDSMSVSMGCSSLGDHCQQVAFGKAPTQRGSVEKSVVGKLHVPSGSEAGRSKSGTGRKRSFFSFEKRSPSPAIVWGICNSM